MPQEHEVPSDVARVPHRQRSPDRVARVHSRQQLKHALIRHAELDRRIAVFDEEFAASARQDEAARRLATVPGIGPINATALAAAVGDASAFNQPTMTGIWGVRLSAVEFAALFSGIDWRRVQATREFPKPSAPA